MLWWIWVVAGLVLVVLELLTPGLFLLFFGAAAIVVGVAAGAGLAMPLWAELLAFSVLSVVSLLVFRGPLLRRMKSRPEDPPVVDDFSGEIGTVQVDIAAGDRGRIELRGTVWTAINDGGDALAAGTRCRVVRADGLTLHVVRDA